MNGHNVVVTKIFFAGLFSLLFSASAHGAVALGQECLDFDVKSEKVLVSGYLRFFVYPGRVVELRLFRDESDYVSKRVEKSILVRGMGALYPHRESIENDLVTIEGMVGCLKGADSLAHTVSIQHAKLISAKGRRPDASGEVRRSDLVLINDVSSDFRWSVEAFLEDVRHGRIASASSYLGFNYKSLAKDSYFRKRLDWVLVSGDYSIRSVLRRQRDVDVFFVRDERMKVDAFCRIKAGTGVEVLRENFARLLGVGGYRDGFCVIVDQGQATAFVDKIQFGLSFSPGVQ